jgi:hypothetical protein
MRCTGGLWSGFDENGDSVTDIRLDELRDFEDMRGWLTELLCALGGDAGEAEAARLGSETAQAITRGLPDTPPGLT